MGNRGQLIRTYRLIAGRTQRDLAEAVGCSPTQISLIERGYAHPSPQQLVAISKAIGCPALAEPSHVQGNDDARR